MVRVSQTTKNLVNAFAKDVYGESVEETRAKAKAEIKQMDEKLTKSIILLYTKIDMSIEDIAEHLNFSKDAIKQILQQKNIIKQKKE